MQIYLYYNYCIYIIITPPANSDSTNCLNKFANLVFKRQRPAVVRTQSPKIALCHNNDRPHWVEPAMYCELDQTWGSAECGFSQYLCIYICIFVYLCICVFVYLCICVFVYLCICVFVFARLSSSLGGAGWRELDKTWASAECARFTSTQRRCNELAFTAIAIHHFVFYSEEHLPKHLTAKKENVSN